MHTPPACSECAHSLPSSHQLASHSQHACTQSQEVQLLISSHLTSPHLTSLCVSHSVKPSCSLFTGCQSTQSDLSACMHTGLSVSLISSHLITSQSQSHSHCVLTTLSMQLRLAQSDLSGLLCQLASSLACQPPQKKGKRVQAPGTPTG